MSKEDGDHPRRWPPLLLANFVNPDEIGILGRITYAK